jgi:hypothetical protein
MLDVSLPVLDAGERDRHYPAREHYRNRWCQHLVELSAASGPAAALRLRPAVVWSLTRDAAGLRGASQQGWFDQG